MPIVSTKERSPSDSGCRDLTGCRDIYVSSCRTVEYLNVVWNAVPVPPRCRAVAAPAYVDPVALDACDDCGGPQPRVRLGTAVLCDRCADRRIAAKTGFPELPDPPPAIERTTLDGRRITLRFRLWRAATGIEMELEEDGLEPREGFHLAVLGAHDADPDVLAAYLRHRADEELGRRYLTSNPHRAGWILAEGHDELSGRLVWNDEGNEIGTPYDVVVDGRKMTWEQLGQALEGYEGWRFRLVIEDSIDDLRPESDVVSMDQDHREDP